MVTIVRIPSWVWLIVILVTAVSATAGESGQDRVYLFRGAGGYLSKSEGRVVGKFKARGMDVVSFKYHERSNAAKEIARAYKNGELPDGIVLVGYSLGASAVVRISRKLENQGIPVRLLFVIETCNPLQTIPTNVEEAFVFYHVPALVGHNLRADSTETKLTRCNFYRDAGFGIEFTHFLIPFLNEVHEYAASELEKAMNR
tara:strand:- start:3333 stop:3935 length:603 start_codon:yes stop_codon:yes gene_type:complete